MNKKISSIIFLLLGIGLMISFGACSDDDNKNNYEVSDEWKDYQRTTLVKIQGLAKDGVYKALTSESGLGSVYYRTSDYINNNIKGNFDKDGPVVFEVSKPVKSSRKVVELEQPFYDTDSVLVRYEGWFYTTNGDRFVFDSTERTIGVNGESIINTKEHVGFNIGKDNIDGFKTVLMDMKVGDERVVCIPYTMAYGMYGKTNLQGELVIPGYTTLFFDIKVLKVLREY